MRNTIMTVVFHLEDKGGMSRQNVGNQLQDVTASLWFNSRLADLR
jgi:hypothetical protein